jgi:signal transduction histidine kinase
VKTPGLAGWLAIITAFLVTAAVSAVSIAGIRLLRDLAEAEALARVELGAAAAREELRQVSDGLLSAARLLGERPTLLEIMEQPGGGAMTSYLTRYCDSAALDTCAVLRDGLPIASVGETLDWADLLAAISQGAGSIVTGPANDTAFAAAGAPMPGRPRHAVVAAKRLDSAFSTRLGDRVGLELRIVPVNAIGGDGGPYEDLHRAALRRGAAAASRIEEIDGFAASLPVATPAGEVRALLLAILPRDAVMAPVATMQRRMILIAIAVAVLATAGGILVGRLWIRGVHRLTRAAHRIGSGDLAAPVAAEAAAELGVLASTMEEMRRNLVELTDEIRRRETQARAVLATISHEFRTPLAAQLASIELLRDGIGEMSPAAQHELVSSLERSVQRLSWLIDNLLESVRIESGQLDIRRHPVMLDEVAAAAREVMEPLIIQRGQRLDVLMPDGLPVIAGDRQRLVQVLVNLLANASRFAPGGSTIRIGSAAQGEDGIAIWVDDEGPGPADPGDARLFEPFHRAGGEDTAESGLGLGLFIVNSIVERHGGRVWFERTRDQHTRVKVELPRTST